MANKKVVMDNSSELNKIIKTMMADIKSDTSNVVVNQDHTQEAQQKVTENIESPSTSEASSEQNSAAELTTSPNDRSKNTNKSSKNISSSNIPSSTEADKSDDASEATSCQKLADKRKQQEINEEDWRKMPPPPAKLPKNFLAFPETKMK